MRREAVVFTVLMVSIVVLFVADMLTGSVVLTPGELLGALCGEGDETTVAIVRNIRLTKAITALLAGSALGVSGLLMQTLFRNPLAGPYVLGITSGASLGVALFILGGSAIGISLRGASSLGLAGGAWIGAAAVLAMVGAVGRYVKDIMVILVLGIMFSSGVSAVVQVLQYLSGEEQLKSYLMWTMGSLGDVTVGQLWLFVPAVVAGLGVSVGVIKPLNLLLLGEQYAVTMGLNVRRSRMLIFLATTLLAGTVTAFCGPIGFIGLAVPHIARLMTRRADIRTLLPATLLTGMVLMLVCDIVSKQMLLPINSITALLGIPVVIWIVFRLQRR